VFRFSIQKALVIAAMAAMVGIIFFCWWPRSRNPDKPILAGPAPAENSGFSVHKSNASDGLEKVLFIAAPAPTPTVQVMFTKPEGMQVRWDVMQTGAFDSMPIVVPGRQNFPQNAIYRLKVANLKKIPGVELYPTIEIGPVAPRSEAFLALNAIPVQFTDKDLDEVMAGNFVTKVVYLPDPEFQELALAGVDTLVSTRLDPGVDPITEADRRGAILAIVRLGNKDVELPGSGH